MAYYSYCIETNCDAGLDIPTLADAVIGYQKCPICGAVQPYLEDFIRRDILDEVEEKLTNVKVKTRICP